MQGIYTIVIQLYRAAILLASVKNSKAKKWIEGRKDWAASLSRIDRQGKQLYWFHFASLGEFEQGRPIMEQLKKEQPACFLLITFFSPSGYEVRKNYEFAGHVCYLPIDTGKNAIQFIELTKPAAAFFVKYEFWFNYLHELKRNSIPVFLVSGIFRKRQHFFQWYGWWFRNQLRAFTYFFVQNNESKNLLNSIGFQNVEITGDTRFDRVRKVAKKSEDIPLIKQFAHDSFVFVVGSNWPKDDELLIPFINAQSNKLKFIIAPHNIDELQIQALIDKLKLPVLRFSEANERNIDYVDILIVDSIGMLSTLYRYAQFAYIGGGFGANVHNILEAAAYGIPAIFGPNYRKFQECTDLVGMGGAFSIIDLAEMKRIFAMLLNEHFYKKAAVIANAYVIQKSGATDLILLRLKQYPFIFQENKLHIQS